ncbi:hypothetical protein LJB92_03965 [Bacteroidales bacterium OttesenSCG-928-M06]|nr:hypothetical protein [Bacteroidales bacterium OttesenSCG-928-M06]
MLQKKKQILAGILVFLFAFYYVNVSFFYHSHTINGNTISHSHFHNKAHSQAGTHNANEILLISTLSHFQSLQATVCFVAIGLFLLAVTIFRIGSEQKPVSVILTHFNLRAPPALS